MPKKLGFWDFANNHPLFTFLGTCAVAVGVVGIVACIKKKPCPPCIEQPLIKIL